MYLSKKIYPVPGPSSNTRIRDMILLEYDPSAFIRLFSSACGGQKPRRR